MATFCAVIPTYDNPRTIAAVVADVMPHVETVIVVDDGSGADARRAIDALPDAGVVVVRRASNGGKGAAVRDGLAEAERLGFSHALQVDADGQHDLSQIPAFIQASERRPDALVLGQPVFDESVPRGRLLARQITRFWTIVETGGDVVGDPMCGYRVYPVAETLAARPQTERMDFDIEIAVRLAWRGVPVVHVPTRVRYLDESEGGVSHFDLVRDNLAISRTHARLVLERWWRRLTGRRVARGETLGEPRQWLDIEEKGTLLGIKAVLAATQLLGRRRARTLVDAIVLYYTLLDPDVRRRSRDWLERVARISGDARPVGFADVLRHVRTFGHVTLDRLLIAQGATDALTFSAFDREPILRHLDAGRGVLLLGAHLGSFEAMHRLGTERGLKINILAHIENAAHINAVLEELGSSTHARLIAIRRGEVDGMLEAAAAVRRGEIVAMLGDRIGIGDRTLEIDFMGDRARFPAGPILVASILGCPVVLCLGIYRPPSTYSLVVEPFADRIKLPGGRRKHEAAREWVQRYADRLSVHAQRAPYNWFNFYDFFEL